MVVCSSCYYSVRPGGFYCLFVQVVTTLLVTTLLFGRRQNLLGDRPGGSPDPSSKMNVTSGYFKGAHRMKVASKVTAGDSSACRPSRIGERLPGKILASISRGHPVARRLPLRGGGAPPARFPWFVHGLCSDKTFGLRQRPGWGSGTYGFFFLLWVFFPKQPVVQ